MRPYWITLAALPLLALPQAAAAQVETEEATLPRALFISQWQCPAAALRGIARQYDSLVVPVEQELVNEGKLYGAGMFFHEWGDEWNLNWYRLGENRDQVFAALPEINRRLRERHPDAPNMLESCAAHRDNIYWWGPRTAPPSQ